MWERFCYFGVVGIPRPGGSKSPFPYAQAVNYLPRPADVATPEALLAWLNRKGKDRPVRFGVHVSDASTYGPAWRKAIRKAAACQGLPAPEPGWAYVVRLRFYMPRPKNHFRANGQVKDWAAGLEHTSAPDALKLGRAVEDALTGIVWHDDAASVAIHCSKRYGTRPGVRIWVKRRKSEGKSEGPATVAFQRAQESR